MSGLLLRPPDWTRDAACQGLAVQGLDPWHPDDALPAAERDVQHALARLVCARCPVRHPCALEALKGAVGHGVWGGLTPADRRRIARKHGYPLPGAAQHGDRSAYVAGCRCGDCREAHRRWAEGRRAAGAWRTRRTSPPPPCLTLPLGTGRRRAWPGQCVLFTDGLPATALRPADTTGRTLAA